jgi:membrane protein
MSVPFFLSLLKDTAAQWTAHKAQRLGAALAYYTIFSLAPLLIIFIAIIGFVYGPEAAQAELIDRLQTLVGSESAAFVATMVASAHRSNSDVVATLFGLGTLIFGALNVFSQLQDAINTIWDVKPAAGSAVRRMVRDRLVSLAMVLGVGFLLLVSLIASTALVAAGRSFGALLPMPAVALETLNLAFWLVVATLLYAMLFKFLPDAPVSWSDVWHGALLTSLLFSLGRLAIAMYLAAGAISSIYGAAGSLAALLIWVYYSAQILLFGAEFTHVYALRVRAPAAAAASARKEPLHG